MTQVMRSFGELGSVFGLKKSTNNRGDNPKKRPVTQKNRKMQSNVAKTATPTKEAVSTYESLGVFEGVVMKLPKKSGFMTYKPAFTIPGGDTVSEHWHNGKALGQKIYFNVFFYKITSKDLGKRAVGTVEVIEKTRADGKKFCMMDFTHTPEAPCRYNFAMPKDGTGDFTIDERVAEKIAFLPRKHDKLKL